MEHTSYIDWDNQDPYSFQKLVDFQERPAYFQEQPADSHQQHAHFLEQPAHFQEQPIELTGLLNWPTQDRVLNSTCQPSAVPSPTWLPYHQDGAISHDTTYQDSPYYSFADQQRAAPFISDSHLLPTTQSSDAFARHEDIFTTPLELGISTREPACDHLLDYSLQLDHPSEPGLTSKDAAVCDKCGLAFRGGYRRGNLARHIRTQHTPPAFRCEVPGCFKVCARLDKLKDHVRNAHKGYVNVGVDGSLEFEGCVPPQTHPPPSTGFTCSDPSCSKSFDRHCDLYRHQKTHLSSSERPHQCSICGEGFLYPKDLTRHQRKHNSSKQEMFYCPVPGCPHEGFSRRDNLLRHQRKQHPGQISA